MSEQLTGRELDAEVAVKVMGWSMYHYDKDYADNCYWMLMDGDCNPVAEIKRTPAGFDTGERKTEAEAWADCPAFSTDIAAAWQVMERMVSRGWWPLVQLDDHAEKWICQFQDQYGEGFSDEAKTAPEAICRAALAAIGGEP